VNAFVPPNNQAANNAAPGRDFESGMGAPIATILFRILLPFLFLLSNLNLSNNLSNLNNSRRLLSIRSRPFQTRTANEQVILSLSPRIQMI
jgi:hypothetical protein